MEDTAVSLCKSVLDVVLGHAKSMVAEEVALQLGVQRDVAIIADEFEMMRYFLMTGDNNQDLGWVRQVRDLAYDVEDVLERLAAKADQLEKPSRWRIPRILCERRRATLEVKELLARVADVAFVSKRSLYSRLVKGSEADPATLAVAEQSEIFAAIAAIDEARHPTAAGLDKSKVNLLQLIDDGVEDLRVIVVWGTSFDLDKTSSVKEAYDLRVEKFDCRAWLKLASPFRQDELLRNLVSQLSAEKTGGTAEKYAFAELEEMATKFLSEKRFLIVIDGICSIVDWDWIKTYFPDKKNGSRIIVSTRQVEIASLCTERPYQVSELMQLASDQALYLFHYKAKPQADSDETISDLSTMAVAVESLVKREYDKSVIIKLIHGAHESNVCKVISLWGMGGIGKTTIVKRVYESQELASLFQNRAWITVARPFNLESSLRSIGRQLDGSNAGWDNEIGLREMMDAITGLLGRLQRCLIVLDDLTSKEEWDSIAKVLGKAAVVIVTTRDKNLASYCSRNGQYMYNIRILSEHDALELFLRKVFKKDEYFPLKSDLMEEAKLILKKCGGLPLAISVIGSFLSDKPKTIAEWRKLNDHISSELEDNEGLQTTQGLFSLNTILDRSYNNLPYHLKACFLYMAIFPEDYNIKRKRLIRLWVAEGYSREMQHMTAEEVGDKHFAELFDRSMILPATKVTHSTGKIYSCVLHDLVRQICISKSMEEELVFTLEEGCSSNTKSKVRQLAISNNWRRDKDVFDRILDLSRLRSLTVFGEWRSFFLSDSTKLLRVLDLEDASGLTDHHLNQICELLHLKYLSLRGCKSIFKMPDSLGNLRQLDTLDIRGTHIFKLPSTFNKLRKLQHLHASAWFKDEHKAGSSTSNELVTDSLKWHDKLNLSCGCNKNFYFLGRPASCVVQVPRGIGKLNAVRTLGYVRFAHGKGNASVKELKDLTQLRKLELHGVERTNSMNFWSAISGHQHLRSLSVNRDCVADELDCYLGGSLSPPKYLENLKLWGRLVRVMDWIYQLQYLSKLQLHRSGLNQDAIQAIGKLPNLAILRFWESSFLGEELKFEGGSFPSLIQLELRKLSVLTSVRFEDGAMPKLELLQAAGWSKLQEFSGLGYLRRIKEIQLGPEFSDDFKKNVQRQRTEHRNNFSLKLKSDQYTLLRDLESA
ncbi:disease resistance protein RPM1-like [Phragmites australis]|uniref:disease resistance protein RPM1-like n=1 Tax=Phragmites australis TaxID=29695 RepID=UPI002D77FEF5|nr:disease resistance protein RPM1-like [Phragmites australis]